MALVVKVVVVVVAPVRVGMVMVLVCWSHGGVRTAPDGAGHAPPAYGSHPSVAPSSREHARMALIRRRATHGINNTTNTNKTSTPRSINPTQRNNNLLGPWAIGAWKRW